jgi:hypothetical protein
MAVAHVGGKSLCHQIALQKDNARLDSKLSSQAQPNALGPAPQTRASIDLKTARRCF